MFIEPESNEWRYSFKWHWITFYISHCIFNAALPELPVHDLSVVTEYSTPLIPKPAVLKSCLAKVRTSSDPHYLQHSRYGVSSERLSALCCTGDRWCVAHRTQQSTKRPNQKHGPWINVFLKEKFTNSVPLYPALIPCIFLSQNGNATVWNRKRTIKYDLI
jgi:hypothetical protein